MKKGISYMPGLSSNSHPEPPKEIFKIPVVYLADSKHPIADARGFGKKAKIIVGPYWRNLDERTRMAVLYHEAAHILGRHREIRAVMLLVMLVPAFIFLPWQILTWIAITTIFYFCMERIAQDQELEADRFAAKNGLGKELLAFVRAMGAPAQQPYFYPDFERRVGKLARYLEETE